MTDKKQIYRDALIEAEFAGCPYTLASAVETIYSEIVKLSKKELHSFRCGKMQGLQGLPESILVVAEDYSVLTESRYILMKGPQD